MSILRSWVIKVIGVSLLGLSWGAFAAAEPAMSAVSPAQEELKLKSPAHFYVTFSLKYHKDGIPTTVTTGALSLLPNQPAPIQVTTETSYLGKIVRVDPELGLTIAEQAGGGEGGAKETETPSVSSSAKSTPYLSPLTLTHGFTAQMVLKPEAAQSGVLDLQWKYVHLLKMEEVKVMGETLQTPITRTLEQHASWPVRVDRHPSRHVFNYMVNPHESYSLVFYVRYIAP